MPLVPGAFHTAPSSLSITDRNHVASSYPFHAKMCANTARPQAPATRTSRPSRPALDAAAFIRRLHATPFVPSPLAGSQEFAVGGAILVLSGNGAWVGSLTVVSG